MHLRSRQRRAYIGWIALLGAGLAVAVIGTQGVAAQNDTRLENPVAFAESSYAGVCAECHGGDGNGGVVPGTDRRAPTLRDPDEVNAAYLDLVLRTGRMPPAGDPFDNRAREIFYDDAERDAMVAWMTEEFDLPGEIPAVAEGNVALGLEVFALNCAHCHGNSGAGGTAGQAAWTPQVNDRSPIAVAEAIRVGPFEMPAFSDDVLSDEEVNAVASYLQAVDEESGTPVLGLVELNPVFASGFVALFAGALIGSLLFIGGRPTSLETASESVEVAEDPPATEDQPTGDGDVGPTGDVATVEDQRRRVPTSISTPNDTTLMPGDPAYDRAVEEAREQEKGIPYLDEDTGAITTGRPMSTSSGLSDSPDEPGEDPPDDTDPPPSEDLRGHQPHGEPAEEPTDADRGEGV